MLFFRSGAKNSDKGDEAVRSLDERIDPLKAISDYRSREPRDRYEAWVLQGFDNWIKAGGALSLEQSFGITYRRLCRFQRDEALRNAMSMIDANNIWIGSKKLEKEWNRFMTCGLWNAWRVNLTPPPEASKLHAALFWATLNNNSQSLTAARIRQILS